jgi:hypothetical protein
MGKTDKDEDIIIDEEQTEEAPKKRGRGHPKAKIDKTEFEKLCKLQCTREEILDWFGCTEKPLLRWCQETYGTDFKGAFAMFRGRGKISLRRAQWDMAQSNPTMAIFLGKQYLGQSDKVEAKVQQTADETIQAMNEFFADKKFKLGEDNKED